jgi:prephenate dehydrogenase
MSIWATRLLCDPILPRIEVGVKKRSGETYPRYLRGMSVGVVGLGQIGGSIVRRLSRFRPALTLLGTDHNNSIAPLARRYCRWRSSVDALVSESDLVILAVPVPVIVDLLPSVATHATTRDLRNRLLVTDTGTVKLPILRAARRYRKAFDYVGLHPLSGTEQSGWRAARADLFVDDKIVCFERGANRKVRIAHELIRLLGGRCITIDAAKHDRLIATTIGLPHLLAYAVQGLPGRTEDVKRLHGRSWGSLTRVAASDPAMVGGFLFTNAREQKRVARQLQRHLDQLIDALDDPTGQRLESLLRRWRRRATE